jgi:alkylation response protein AidB-like acyl-CoA dehydrogenase
MADWSRLVRWWWSMPDKVATDEYKMWEKSLLNERLICGHWPTRYGGRDLKESQARVIDEECLRANVPRLFREQGEAWVGPSILAHGTDAQKEYFLPKIVDGTHRYCQGFSEPDHGSDLGSLETRGIIDGNEISITGQKIWTTAAVHANQIFVLCRTDPAAENKYRGISYVIVDIASNKGRLEFRPIRTLTGASEFASSFFDDTRAPVDHIIGGLNQGWGVAMTTLENERSGRAAASRNALLKKEFDDLVAVARRDGRVDDPEVRRKFGLCYATLQVLNWWATPGRPGANQSVQKLIASEWSQRFGELAFEVLGESAVVRPDQSEEPDEPQAGYTLNRWQQSYLGSLSGTIASGSSEIQRNVISERILRLPREYRPS